MVLSLNKLYHARVLQKLGQLGLPLKVYIVEQGEWKITSLPQEAT